MTFADPRRFLYRTLDPDAAARLAARHLAGHDDGELYLQYSASEAFGFAEKVALCQRIDAAARARDPRVSQVSVALAASWSVIDIVRGDGFVGSDIRPLVRLGVQIVAEQNGRRETGYHGLGGRYLYDN